MSEISLRGSMVHSLVRELAHERASGVVVCSADDVIKTVRLWQGRVVSAGSTLIDDRLGEIIYREGTLSLDAFVDAAGKVTQTTRFGEVLVRQGIFSPVQLWESLNLQAREIMRSLAFYPDMRITVEENEQAPQSELAVQFDFELIFAESAREAAVVREFAAAHRQRPALEVDEGSRGLPLNDFERDLVGLVDQYRNFNDLVDRGSRLSPIYTCRALHRLHSKGVLRDLNELHRKRAGEGAYGALRQMVDHANFIFAQVAAASEQERVGAWGDICSGASSVLEKELGEGCFVSTADGFRFEAIFAAFIAQPRLRAHAAEQIERNWPEPALSIARDAIYASVLFIFFEIYNKKYGSPGFAQVKGLLEGLRHSVYDR